MTVPGWARMTKYAVKLAATEEGLHDASRG
jgi:hypothetical protein